MGESKRFKTDVDKKNLNFFKCYFNIYLSMLVLLDHSFFLLATFAVLFCFFVATCSFPVWDQ